MGPRGARESVDGGCAAVIARGLPAWREYLRRFDDRDELPALFWTANAWASMVGVSVDDTNALLDLPFAVALAERARELDPDFENGSVHAFFGVYYASTAESPGGRPARARESFESALRVSQRRYLTWQVLYARAYAVQAQDRALFEHLLREVVAAADVMPSQRLANQVAKRRAMGYLGEADALFSAPATEGTP